MAKENAINNLKEMAENMPNAINDLKMINEEMAKAKSWREYDEEAGEVNLIEYVDNKFKELGVEDYTWWQQGRLQGHDLETTPMSYQRLIVNRALNLIIADYDDLDTRDYRYLLINNGSLEAWKKLVDEVLEFIVKYERKELPQSLFEGPRALSDIVNKIDLKDKD